MKRWWQCMAFVMAVATPGFAQDLAMGTRLRVTRANGKSITGQLAALDERNFTLEQSDHVSGNSKQVVVSWKDIQRIEISHRPGRKKRGLAIGLVAGALLGGALGYAAGCSPQEFLCIYPRSFTTPTLAFVGGALGAGIGALVAHGEKWETVGPAHVNVSVIPVRRGAGIAVAARF